MIFKTKVPTIVFFLLSFQLGWETSLARAHPVLPQLLQTVEALYSKSASLTAEFIQINDDAVLSKRKKSSGKLYIKRPSKVRWETTLPDPSLFVSDGKKSWFYTPPFEPGERGQIIERQTSEIQSRMTAALLTGTFSIAKEMKIREKTPTTFILIPAPGSAGSITQATIEINVEQKWIEKVTLEHKGGNHTEIQLSKIQLGAPLADNFFNFIIPPNTDRADEDSK